MVRQAFPYFLKKIYHVTAISGIFLVILSDILKTALDKLTKCYRGSGLGVYPSRVEVVFFTRKYKVLNVQFPRLNR